MALPPPPPPLPQGQPHSLQESWLVLLLIMRTELDLTLVPRKLAGLVEGDGVRAIQDVVSGLRERGRPLDISCLGLGQHHWASAAPSSLATLEAGEGDTPAHRGD